MPKQYKHSSQAEREQVAQMYWEGKSLGKIAEALSRDKSTISRELKRNSTPEYKRYTPCRVQARSCERKAKIPNRISIDARPKPVDRRGQCGHWEGDSLVSRKSKAV